MPANQTVTVSFFRYQGLNKIWGMKQMYSARAPMREMEGLMFFKPLGTGSGSGYSIWPDFSVFGMLGVWRDEDCADAYLDSRLYKDFLNHSVEQYTIFLKPLSSKGSWSGFRDWEFSTPSGKPVIGALTRATLKPRYLYKFWSMVPRVSRDHDKAEGLLFSMGVGEIPLLEQAIFTIWETKDRMEAFAYKSFHADAIRETRARDGFREEMFTRLQPYRAIGTWKGEDPLAGVL